MAVPKRKVQGNQPRISDQQAAELADIANSGGGFSVKAFGHEAGQKARDSYMVGLPGYGKDFPGSAHASDIIGYVESNRPVLQSPGMHLGGWNGKDPERLSLDVAKAYSRTPGGLAKARLTAVRGNQESIGEVDAGAEYVGDLDNPHYDPGAGHSGNHSTPASRAWATEPIKKRRPAAG